MKILFSSLCLLLIAVSAASQPQTAQSVPRATLLRILRAEDTRTWDDEMRALLLDKSAAVRLRAALAAGRIGDDKAVPALVDLMRKDADNGVQAMAAFALGETEAPSAAEPLIEIVTRKEVQPANLRARAVEALGKIAAALTAIDLVEQERVTHHDHLIEQTLVAILMTSGASGAAHLPPEYDLYLEKGLQGDVCRHYVGGIRHLFELEGLRTLLVDLNFETRWRRFATPSKADINIILAPCFRNMD